jgi:hypothetical protein
VTHLEEQWIRNLGHKTSREKTSITALPLGLQEVEASRIFGQWEHEGGIVVSSTQRPPLPSLPRDISRSTLAHSSAGRIKSMKNRNDPVGNRIRDIPACNAVPQPIAPRRAPRERSL